VTLGPHAPIGLHPDLRNKKAIVTAAIILQLKSDDYLKDNKNQ
jgi:hypothetical protein